jgi:hypothetical protein
VRSQLLFVFLALGKVGCMAIDVAAITDLVSEGAAIGTIMVGGSAFTVQFIPAAHDEGDSPDTASRMDPK